jgi:hypothetical protein
MRTKGFKLKKNIFSSSKTHVKFFGSIFRLEQVAISQNSRYIDVPFIYIYQKIENY